MSYDIEKWQNGAQQAFQSLENSLRNVTDQVNRSGQKHIAYVQSVLSQVEPKNMPRVSMRPFFQRESG